MRKLHKFILIVISLTGLLFSAAMLSLFYYIPGITDVVTFLYYFFPVIHEALAIYVAFVSVCFLLLILASIFAPKASNYLIFVKNGGKLQFSKHTVESTVRYSFADVDGVNPSNVKVMLGSAPEKTRIFVKLAVTDTKSLVELTETVKNKIEAALQSSLGFTAKSISIKVDEMAREGDPQLESRSETAEPDTSSRVI